MNEQTVAMLESNAPLSSHNVEELFVMYRVSHDEKYWDAIKPSLWSTAYYSAMRLLCNADDAQDAAQETIVRILNTAKDFSELAPKKQNLRGYVWITAQRIVIDKFRADSKLIRLDTPLEGGAGETLGTIIPDLSTSSPDDIELTLEQATEVHDCLSCLNGKDRVILILSFDGYSSEELGRAFGLSAGAVRMRKSRAMKEFKECYEKYIGGQSL